MDDATLANVAFHSRLDKLLESAIEEQEREQQGFLTVLQASRDAVDAVRSELDGVRSLIEHREQAVIDLLDGRLALAARQDTIEFLQHRIELLEGEQAALKKALTVKLDGIARSLEAVEWRTQEGMAALANRVGGLESRAEAILKALDPVGRILQVVQSRSLDADGVGAGDAPSPPGNHVSETSGPYDASGPPDPVPVPVASDAGRRGRRGRKPSL